MRVSSIYSFFVSGFLVLAFLLMSQDSVQAQARIINNTGCAIVVWVGQNNGGCSAACSVSNQVQLLSGGSVSFPSNCMTENWLGVSWYPVGSLSNVGRSHNPATACDPDISGLCNGSSVSGSWSGPGSTGSGTGTVTVRLQ